MPITSKNLGAGFDSATPRDKVALIDLRVPGRPVELTYGALDAECDAVARGLVARGFARGDRIGILSLNRFEAVAAFLGAMRAGLVAVPLSFKLGREVLARVMRDADLKVMFCDAERADLCPPDLPHIGFDDPDGYTRLRDPGPFEAVEPVGRELAMILYTSGSTGVPKGVLLSHESQRWAMERFETLVGDLARHRFIVAAPMFHMNATFSIKFPLRNGASVVLLPTFDAVDYARAIERFRVTWLTSVPTMLALMMQQFDRLAGLDVSSVEWITMGSAPLTQALVDKVQAWFPGATINNGYGTTEGGPVPFGPHPAGIRRPPISCGYPVPGTEVELRGGPSPDEGVLYMRSPMLMEGYNNLPGKTAEVMCDGWYCTGDTMRRDKDGIYYFVGRADDMFVVGGENVWPLEVERRIEQMEGVEQAVVVPVPDEIKGMLPFAFVVRRAGTALDEQAVKAFTISSGPAFAHPRFVEFLDRIPLAATNKPDRTHLTGLATRIAAQRRAQAAGHAAPARGSAST